MPTTFVSQQMWFEKPRREGVMRLWERKPRNITAMGGVNLLKLVFPEGLLHPTLTTTGLRRNFRGTLNPLQPRGTGACHYDHLYS
jgi:hypothetical protein